jgi:hypothetical protein
MAERDTGLDVTSLYFFPDSPVTEEEARRMLAGEPEERAVVVSHLLRYAEWDDIWRYVSPAKVSIDRLSYSDLVGSPLQVTCRQLTSKRTAGCYAN